MSTVWIDEDGTEHPIEIIKETIPGWLLIRFTDSTGPTSVVQERHIRRQ